MSEEDDHVLILPFLDDSHSFANGVEIGLLVARMRGDEDVIEDHFSLQNEDMVLLAASRLGWHVVAIDYPEEYVQWFFVRMERKR